LPKLGQRELSRLLASADEYDVAFSVASFSGTPVQSIRSAVDEVRIRAPHPATDKAVELDALC
jgi:hypothetical protein